MKIKAFTVLFMLNLTVSVCWAEPPRPAQMSREELGVILKSFPGEMCELKNLQLIFRDRVNSIYNIFLGNPSSQICELTYKIWRNEVATLPDGTPAPSGYYELKTLIINGDPKKCPCQ